MMNKHIQELKNFKPPFWSRWLGNYRVWKRIRFRNKQWHHVTIITIWADHHIFHRSEKTVVKFNSWYVLSEREDGRRRYKYLRGTYPMDYKTGPTYARIIVPWLDGGLNNKQVKEHAEQTHVQKT